MQPGSGVRGLLFVCGGLYHLVAFRILVNWLYQEASNRPVVDHVLTKAGVAILGGTFVSVLVTPVVAKARQRIASNPGATLLRMTFWSLLATLLTFQSVLLLGAAYLAGAAYHPGDGLLGLFFLSFLDVEIYGVQVLFLSVPFGLMFGILVGAVLVGISKAHATGGRGTVNPA